ncbi:MAG: head GIN domain-containing protein [Terricaulis sp.]
MRLILAASALVLATAGAAHAETRNLSGFTKVDANAGTDVEVTVGGAYRVEVTGRDADRIVTRIDGDTLVVEPVRGFSWRGRQANIRVTMPRVEGLSASSGADLVATGVSGGAIALDSSSGADLRVSGTCANFTADASSGSDLDARQLRCESGSVDVSSGAGARVFASGRLDVDASSGGGVIAYGNPGIGNIDLSSGGSLRRAD